VVAAGQRPRVKAKHVQKGELSALRDVEQAIGGAVARSRSCRAGHHRPLADLARDVEITVSSESSAILATCVMDGCVE
jgi:hypothetical protein